MDRKLKNPKERKRARRASTIRKRVEGSAERPRLSVFRSAKHIYAQLIDDIHGRTLATASTLSTDVKPELQGKKKVDEAEQVGKKIAALAKAAGVSKVVFDRSGYPYHGRVAALAKGARSGGLEF
jgi:large subunit ribosomal protein L18